MLIPHHPSVVVYTYGRNNNSINLFYGILTHELERFICIGRISMVGKVFDEK